jgi:peptide/nickel transport system permease protein
MRTEVALRMPTVRTSRMAAVGLVVLTLIVAACFLTAPFLSDGTAVDLSGPASGASGPSAQHWFGTNTLDRDLLAQVLSGGRTSLLVGAGVALISTVVGTAIGALAGYYRGVVDQVLMRVVDLLLLLPPLPLALAASTVGQLGPVGLRTPLGVTLILSMLLWAPLARIVRGLVLGLREREFVVAARSLGATDTRIILRHLLPNASGPILVHATLAVASGVVLEGALSFLGFGSGHTWGGLLSGSVSELQLYPWLTLFPGLALFLTVLSVNFIGEGARLVAVHKEVRT